MLSLITSAQIQPPNTPMLRFQGAVNSGGRYSTPDRWECGLGETRPGGRGRSSDAAASWTLGVGQWGVDAGETSMV